MWLGYFEEFPDSSLKVNPWRTWRSTFAISTATLRVVRFQASAELPNYRSDEVVRHGGKHDWHRNPKTGVSQPVPRHREIKEFLAQNILKKLGH